MIPKLDELLSVKTTILLGAGASFDYGFPLWIKLKEDLLEALNNHKDYGIDNDSGVDWWVEALNKMSDSDTVDKIATNAPAEHFDLFRNILGIVICKYEAEDSTKQTTGWIENFAAKFCELLKSKYPDTDSIQQIISNIDIITLNYDRVFNIRFNNQVVTCFKKSLTKPREFEKKFKSIFSRLPTIYHPHGCLGSSDEGGNPSYATYLKPNNSSTRINYGDLDKVQHYIKSNRPPYLLPVDDLADADNQTYIEANKILENSKNVICIGISPAGIEGSQLDLSKVDVVYYSGKEKLRDNFIPLGKYASDIINEI